MFGSIKYPLSISPHCPSRKNIQVFNGKTFRSLCIYLLTDILYLSASFLLYGCGVLFLHSAVTVVLSCSPVSWSSVLKLLYLFKYVIYSNMFLMSTLCVAVSVGKL